MRTLYKDWQSFLQRDVLAENVVRHVMEREGLAESEVLFYLLHLWRDRNPRRERRHSFERWTRGPLGPELRCCTLTWRAVLGAAVC